MDGHLSRAEFAAERLDSEDTSNWWQMEAIDISHSRLMAAQGGEHEESIGGPRPPANLQLLCGLICLARLSRTQTKRALAIAWECLCVIGLVLRPVRVCWLKEAVCVCVCVKVSRVVKGREQRARSTRANRRDCARSFSVGQNPGLPN